MICCKAGNFEARNSLNLFGGYQSTLVGNSALFPSDIIDFAMLLAHRLWRETVSLLDVMWPWSNQWECSLFGKNFQLHKTKICGYALFSFPQPHQAVNPPASESQPIRVHHRDAISQQGAQILDYAFVTYLPVVCFRWATQQKFYMNNVNWPVN